jgi:metal-dependent amidase/aminoacylase/carboxypeptidase family protein
MGISNLKDLVDDGQPVSPEEIDAHHQKLADEAKQSFETRAEVEMSYASDRDDNEEKYQAKLIKAQEQRERAHKRNLEQRDKALEKLGLNPNGSDPRERPQGIF